MRETNIIRKAKQGDRSAQSELYTTYYKKVYYLALKMTGSCEDAEDIAQDSFLAAFRALPKLEKDEAFEKWLMQIAANRCRNRIGQQKFTAELPENFEEYEPDPNEGLLPENILQEEAKREIILGILRSLPEAQRECVMLFYYSGLSVKEIAVHLGVSEGTVKSRLNYARQKIRAAVEETEERDGIRLHALCPFWLLLAKDFESVAAGCTVPALAAGGTAATAAAVSTAVKAGAFAALKTKVIAAVAAVTILAGGTAVVATQTDLFTDRETPAAADTAAPGEDSDHKKTEQPEQNADSGKVSDRGEKESLSAEEKAEKERLRALSALRSIPYYGDIENCTMTAEQAHAYAQLIADGLAGRFEGYSGYGWPVEEGKIFWDVPYAVSGYSGIYETDRANVILGDFAADGNPYLHVYSSLVDDSYEIFGWNGAEVEQVFGAECYQGREGSTLSHAPYGGPVTASLGGSAGAAAWGNDSYIFSNGGCELVNSYYVYLDWETELWHVIQNGVETVYTQEEYEALQQSQDPGASAATPPAQSASYAPLNEVKASPATLREMLAALNEYSSILSGGSIQPVTVPELTPMAEAMLEALESYASGEITNAVLQDMNGDGVQELLVGYKYGCDVYAWENGTLSKWTVGEWCEVIAIIRYERTKEYGLYLFQDTPPLDTIDLLFASGNISYRTESVEDVNAPLGYTMNYYRNGEELAGDVYYAVKEAELLDCTTVIYLCNWHTVESRLSETVAAIKTMKA